MDETFDWRGKSFASGETPETIIKWWQVTPHPTDPGRVLVERSWQKLLQTVGVNLDTFLESSTEDELAGGVSMKFKLVQGTLERYRELSDFWAGVSWQRQQETKELAEARSVIGEIVGYLDPHPPAKPMQQEALDIAENYLMRGRNE